ncbi:MAG TPA: hypothetical protein VFD01_22310 [Candidatus Dormibacteraeota bacterium]|nr:hypothetical protein [Candidatus Dormibacteraeota bacterium]
MGGLLPGREQAAGLALLFTAPDDREHVERATATGLAVRAQARALGLGDAPGPVRVHLGLNTGPVALSKPRPDAPVHTWSARGGVLDLARRLATCLGPGPLVASPATYRLARGAYQAHGTMPLYDPHRPPATVYVVSREKPVVTWRSQLAAHPVELVDREVEQARLREAWSTVRAGRGRVVHLVAELGGGKSKLLQAFERWLRAEAGAETVLRVWGTC